MNTNQMNAEPEIVEQAAAGNREALETLLTRLQDPIFHLSLRMLGTVHDAEDATQEILLKVMTKLSSFRRESAFSTWVFRIAANHLCTCKKHMFAQHPLSFEFYGADIESGKEKEIPALSQALDQRLLEQELKLSCTNVMLQCLDPESRCIFILGTMFRADSRIAGEILNMSPENYRQRLSRARRKMADFLKEYCGHAGGKCSCAKRTAYAAANHRIDPAAPEYTPLAVPLSNEKTEEFVNQMEQIDDQSLLFSTLPAFRATPAARKFLMDFLQSEQCSYIMNAK
ncbi:RNA polymerase sigma factor [Eisenbergiella sp.]